MTFYSDEDYEVEYRPKPGPRWSEELRRKAKIKIAHRCWLSSEEDLALSVEQLDRVIAGEHGWDVLINWDKLADILITKGIVLMSEGID